MNYVYLIKTSKGVTKIGRTNNIKRRMQEYRRECGKIKRCLSLPVFNDKLMEKVWMWLFGFVGYKVIKGREYYRQWLVERLFIIPFAFFLWIIYWMLWIVKYSVILFSFSLLVYYIFALVF